MGINKSSNLLPTGAMLLARKKQQSNFNYLRIVLLILLALILTGCVTLSDPEESQEFNQHTVGIIDPTLSVGQSFISRRPFLNGITLWVEALPDNEPQTQSHLTIDLYYSPGDQTPIFTTQIPSHTIGEVAPIKIDIPPQSGTPGQAYYLSISTNQGSYNIKGRNEDAYSRGQAYISGSPVETDIAFYLSYEYNQDSILQDIINWSSHIWIIIPLGAILILPGWLLIESSPFRKKYNLVEKIAMSTGISLAVIPVVMLWTSTVGIRWNRTSVIIVYSILAVLLVFLLSKRYLNSKKSSNEINAQGANDDSVSHNNLRIEYLVLFGIFLIALTVRLAMVRDLATPAWVDSVHHSLITQVISITGGYPDTYAPFLSFDPEYYHPGFHSQAATFQWLSGLLTSDALLVFGQVLNAMSVFAVYLLTTTLTKNRIAALFAALITGLFTPMPAYYTSWGRYTQLSALLILPACMVLFHQAMNALEKRNRWICILLNGVITGGLFLVHYRVAAFYICFLVAYFLSRVLFNPKETLKIGKKFIFVLLSSGIVTIFMILPWLLPTIKDIILPRLLPRGATEVKFFSDFSWRYLTTALGIEALVLAGLGIIWGLIQRMRFIITLLLWVGLLFILANLDALKLPGGGFVNNTSVEIALFIPISILGGYFISQLVSAWRDVFPERIQIVFNVSLLLIGLTVALYAARSLLPILNPITFLSRQPDRLGITWVQENIPIEEKVLINPFLWGYGLYAGHDGGFWITPLTGRVTMPPPVLYGLGSEEYRQNINDISQKIMNLGESPGELWDYLKENEIKYVFTGARGGLISPKALDESEYFTQRYNQDGVWIFEVLP
jgi:hypothetical protein